MNSESKSRVVYENLDTTFVNLWALLRNLSQRGFVGRVRVELKDYTADVFMTGSSTPLVHEIDRATGTDTLEEAALHRLVLRVRETPGTITVFEGVDEAVAVSANADSKNKASDSDRVPKSEVRDLPGHYAPDAYTETEVDAASGAGNDPPLTAETNFAPSWSSADSQTLTDRNDEADSSAAPMPALPPTEPIDEIEWSAIVKASGELIGGVERALTGAGADFISLFDTVRLELADDYTFLDPMAGEFIYSNSVVTLAGETPVGSYVSGLSEALRRVVDRVAIGDHARRVRERIALELFSVARKRKEILDRSGFLPQLDRIAGTKVI
jgi:hypothetical protein